MDIRVGTLVKRRDNLPAPRFGKRRFIPGQSGTVGGCAASLMSPGCSYEVKVVRPDGSLLLAGFVIPVSRKHVTKV